MQDDDMLGRLALLDACAISDALDAMGVQGVLLGLSALSGARRICGRAITVQLGLADGRPSPRHLCTAAVEASGPGKIIMIAHEARTEVAGWGGILSLAASRNGATGVIVDGACRDLDESRALGLPVYARASVPITARGRIIEYDWNVPVVMAGVSVSPNDLIIADGSGVVCVPQALETELIGRAEEIVRRERLMADAVEAGDPVSQVMGAKYETMLEREN
jgi:4-hydroxy-4-methyl-2-oxoglutarate aldolase